MSDKKEKVHLSVTPSAVNLFKIVASDEGKSQSMMFEDILNFYVRHRKEYLQTLDKQIFDIKERLNMSNDIKFNIVVEGKKAKVFEVNGENYILGVPGKEYTIEIGSSSFKRKLIVATVDGLCVLSGKAGDYNTNRGYVFDRGLEIDGWRKSNSNVSKFEFCDIQSSYASLSSEGSKSNVGQIAIAVFEEKEDPSISYRSITCSNTSDTMELFDCESTICATSTSTPRGGAVPKSLGTKWGEEKESHCETVDFKRKNEPFHIEVIHYRTEQQLINMGITKKMLYGEQNLQKAFPGMGFCKPPV